MLYQAGLVGFMFKNEILHKECRRVCCLLYLSSLPSSCLCLHSGSSSPLHLIFAVLASSSQVCTFVLLAALFALPECPTHVQPSLSSLLLLGQLTDVINWTYRPWEMVFGRVSKHTFDIQWAVCWDLSAMVSLITVVL